MTVAPHKHLRADRFDQSRVLAIEGADVVHHPGNRIHLYRLGDSNRATVKHRQHFLLAAGQIPARKNPHFPINNWAAGGFLWRYRWDLNPKHRPVIEWLGFNFPVNSTVFGHHDASWIMPNCFKCGQDVGTPEKPVSMISVGHDLDPRPRLMRPG